MMMTMIMMACRHIPTMTKSHHGGEMSVLIKVGMCQCQIPTIHDKLQLQQLALVSYSNRPQLLRRKTQNRSKLYSIRQDSCQPTLYSPWKVFLLDLLHK